MLPHPHWGELAPNISCVISIIKRIQSVSSTVSEEANNLSQFAWAGGNENSQQYQVKALPHLINKLINKPTRHPTLNATYYNISIWSYTPQIFQSICGYAKIIKLKCLGKLIIIILERDLIGGN